MRSLILILSASFLAAACGGRDPVANDANGAALPEPVNEIGPDAVGAPPDNLAAAASAGPPSGAIPAALHGRWGLTPADCMAGRADAKGLITISAAEIRFYESRAVPGADVHAGPASVDGRFNFSGEGQNWSKFQSLKAEGSKLVRTETNPAASFTYAKC